MPPLRLTEYKRLAPKFADPSRARSQRVQQHVALRQNIREEEFSSRRAGLQPVTSMEQKSAPMRSHPTKENIPVLSESERKKKLMEKLKIYREQKRALEAQRKQEAKKKPPFVVPGIAYHKPDFFNIQSKETKTKHSTQPATTTTSRVVTRSQMKSSVVPPKTDQHEVKKKQFKKTPHPLPKQEGRRIPLEVLNARQSFAPLDFKFAAPVGLPSLHAFEQQLPLDLERLEGLSLRSPAPVRDAQTQGTKIEVMEHLKETLVVPEEQMTRENEAALEANKDEEATDELVNLASSDVKESPKEDEQRQGEPCTVAPVAEIRKGDPSASEYTDVQEKRNISYFRHLIIRETELFHQCCQSWDEILQKESKVPEDIEGSIRSAIGQAKLLEKERFAQFSVLIDQCEHNSGEKEINFVDLDGFWDMIYIQVDDVHKKFANLEKLRSNNWVEEISLVTRKTRSKKQNGPPNPSKRPAAKSNIRALIAEARAKATQVVVASPKTPSATRLENLRKSVGKKEYRKSTVKIDEISHIGAASSQGVEVKAESTTDTKPTVLDASVECIVTPLRPARIVVSPQVRRSVRLMEKIATPFKLEQNTQETRGLIVKDSVRRSARLLVAASTPDKKESKISTPVAARKSSVRRNLLD